MKIEIHLPAALRPYAASREAVAVDARTVEEALSTLAARYPALKSHLIADSNNCFSGVNFYLNAENICHVNGPKTALKDGDALLIVPSFVGG